MEMRIFFIYIMSNTLSPQPEDSNINFSPRLWEKYKKSGYEDGWRNQETESTKSLD